MERAVVSHAGCWSVKINLCRPLAEPLSSFGLSWQLQPFRCSSITAWWNTPITRMKLTRHVYFWQRRTTTHYSRWGEMKKKLIISAISLSHCFGLKWPPPLLPSLSLSLVSDYFLPLVLHCSFDDYLYSLRGNAHSSLAQRSRQQILGGVAQRKEARYSNGRVCCLRYLRQFIFSDA